LARSCDVAKRLAGGQQRADETTTNITPTTTHTHSGLHGDILPTTTTPDPFSPLFLTCIYLDYPLGLAAYIYGIYSILTLENSTISSRTHNKNIATPAQPSVVEPLRHQTPGIARNLSLPQQLARQRILQNNLDPI
jgi:hypothetical protein